MKVRRIPPSGEFRLILPRIFSADNSLGSLGRESGEARNDKGHLAAPLDSVGLEACHRCLGPAWELPQVLNAPFGND